MSTLDRPFGMGLTALAREKRNHQLKQWENSVTDREPQYIVSRRRTGRVKFSHDVIFLAAVSSGDEEEVERLLSEGANVNCSNSDSLTALHLVSRGVNVGTANPPVCVCMCVCVWRGASVLNYTIVQSCLVTVTSLAR